MTPDPDPATALAMLDWQIDLGATEAIGDTPVNRYELEDTAPRAKAAVVVDKPAVAEPAAAMMADPKVAEGQAVAIAQQMAAAAPDLISLKSEINAYEFCDLKKGARNLVFADGNPVARLMIIGEAPGREEDIEGFPFVGKAGQLLDKMLAAIDMSRRSDDPQSAVYITNVLPWRPPQNRDPSPEEMAMLLPFLQRHIELVSPEILIPMGNIACQALLGLRGITRLRGNWTKAAGLPALPMTHPAYLLRTPTAKREAWLDLQEIRARLKGQ